MILLISSDGSDVLFWYALNSAKILCLSLMTSSEYIYPLKGDEGLLRVVNHLFDPFE